MRWKRLTKDERVASRKQHYGHWHRLFALLPKWDLDTRTVYWMEFVWRRGKGQWKAYHGIHDSGNRWTMWRDMRYGNARFVSWEYRGGRQAPEIKQEPLYAEKYPMCSCTSVCEHKGCRCQTQERQEHYG